MRRLQKIWGPLLIYYLYGIGYRVYAQGAGIMWRVGPAQQVLKIICGMTLTGNLTFCVLMFSRARLSKVYVLLSCFVATPFRLLLLVFY